MIMNHKEIAQAILNAIGGKENVSAAAHCATRLRLVLHNEEKIDQAALDSLDVVKGTFSTAGQFQIILGAGIVNEVYKPLVNLVGITEMSTSQVKSAGAKKQNP